MFSDYPRQSTTEFTALMKLSQHEIRLERVSQRLMIG